MVPLSVAIFYAHQKGFRMTEKPALSAMQSPLHGFTKSRGQLFHKLVTDLYEDLSKTELELLEVIVRTLDEIDVLQARLDADGMIVSGSTGQPRVHPAVSALLQLRSLAARLLAQLQLPDELGNTIATPRQTSAKMASKARWSLG